MFTMEAQRKKLIGVHMIKPYMDKTTWIEAVLFDSKTTILNLLFKLVDNHRIIKLTDDGLYVDDSKINLGEYIIRTKDGMIYTMNKKDFEKKYKEVFT